MEKIILTLHPVIKYGQLTHLWSPLTSHNSISAFTFRPFTMIPFCSNSKILKKYNSSYYEDHSCCNELLHRITPGKDVHQFRSFLSTMRTPNSVVVYSCMYAFLRKWDLHVLRTPPFTYAWADNNRYLSHVLVYTLFWCKPVVSTLTQWNDVNMLDLLTVVNKFYIYDHPAMIDWPS